MTEEYTELGHRKIPAIQATVDSLMRTYNDTDVSDAFVEAMVFRLASWRWITDNTDPWSVLCVDGEIIGSGKTPSEAIEDALSRE